MQPLTIASFLWFDPHYRHNDKYVYSLGDVLLWRDMVDKNLTIPHEFVCITDQPEMFDGTSIRPVEIDKRCYYPNKLYQQVMAFHPDGKELYGPRMLTMDLDVVITGNLDAIVSRKEPLVLWRNPARFPFDNPQFGGNRSLYNTSIMLIDSEANREIWNTFVAHPHEVMKRCRAAQEWISAFIGPDCAYWDGSHGIYRPARWDTPGCGVEPGKPLPENTRLVFFPGEQSKPWLEPVRRDFPWIDTYRK